MSDTGNAAAPAAGEGTAVVESPVLAGDTAAPAATAGTPPAADAGAAEPSWRERFAGEDKDALERASRFTTEAEFFKSYRQLENKLRSAPKVPILPEGATEEEIVAHRKALGIPEKPDGYGLAFPETFQANDQATETLGAFAQIAHELNLRPDQAKALLDWNMRLGGQLDQHRAADVADAVSLEIADLRNEFKGRDFAKFFGARNRDGSRAGLGLVGEFLHEQFAHNPEFAEDMVQAKLPTGVPLGNSAEFLKFMARITAERAPDGPAEAGDSGGGGGRSALEEYNQLVTESVDNRREFARSGKQARLDHLAGVIAKRNQAA